MKIVAINSFFIISLTLSLSTVESAGPSTGRITSELDLSADVLLPGLTYYDNHGVLGIYVTENIIISKIKWNDFLLIEFGVTDRFDILLLEPKADNKIQIKTKYRNTEENINRSIKRNIRFPADYRFPEWFRNTPSKVDRLIKMNTISINLSNYDFLNHFVPLPFRQTLGLTLKHNRDTTRISYVYWLHENECNIQKYFATNLVLSPNMSNSIDIFTEYFDDEALIKVCSITVPNDTPILEWLCNFNTFYQDSRRDSSYIISLNLANNDSFEDFNIYALNYEIHIMIKSHILQTRIAGYTRWEPFYFRLFDGTTRCTAIVLLPLGNDQVKIQYVEMDFELGRIETDTFFFPHDYEFPSWVVHSNPKFIERIKSKLICIDLLESRLPEEFNVIEGFDTIEISVKNEFRDKIVVNHVKWNHILYSNNDSLFTLTKIVITASKNSTIQIGIFYKERLDLDQITRGIATVQVNREEIPLWLNEKVNFIESVFKIDRKLAVNLYNDDLEEELNIKKIAQDRMAITVGLNYLDCCTIASVEWNGKKLFEYNDKFTVVKIYFERVVNNELHVEIIYYNDRNSSATLGHSFEDSKLPKWFLDANS